MKKHGKQKIGIYIAAILGAGYLAVAVADDLLRPKPLSGLSLAPEQIAAGLNALVQKGVKTEASWKDKTKRATLTSDVEFSRQANSLAAKLRERRARQLGIAKPAIPITGEQRAHVAALNGAFHAAGGVETHFASENGTVTYLALPKKASTGIKANPASAAKAQPQAVARKFLTENRALLKLDDPDVETQLTGEQTENNGQSHLRFQQTYRGVPLFGKELLVHLDGDRDVYLLQGRYEPTPKTIETLPSITPEAATSEAFKDIGLGVYKLPTSSNTLVIHTSTRGSMKLAYKIVTTPKLDERWIHFVDANSGAVIDRIYDVQEAVVPANGTDLNSNAKNFTAWQADKFYLIDPNTPTPDAGSYDPIAAINAGNPKSDTFILTANNLDGSNLSFVSSTSSVFTDSTAVSAADNTRKVFDYYKNTHGRNSIDGKGGSLLAVIHFENRLENAFWSSPYMVYGDGGDTFKPLAGCLDVAGHEMTHGVVENTAGLIYQNQSGALNESFADIFGAMVDRPDWTLGEDCTKRSPFYLRNMANPALGLSRQPTKMSEYRQLPQTKEGDNGGVHVNSGIPNRAAYLIAEGLSLESLGTSIGREHTEKIFYRALTTYLTQSSQFLDARRATISAAKDLFPGEEVSVARAWDVVEVTDNIGNPTPTPTPTDPVAGNDLMIYLSLPVIPTPPGSGFDIFVQRLANPLTAYNAANDKQSTATNSAHTRPAVFSFNDSTGKLLTDILFVDGTNNISATELDPANLTFLPIDPFTDTGKFASIAISPDGRFFAYTTTDSTDNEIHFLDGNDASGASDFNVTVVPENHQDPNNKVQNTVLYADALHFDYSGRYVIFDAFNCASVPGSPCSNAGGGFNYWSIGRVDLQTKQVLYLIPNQDPLVDTGNPVFATNSQSIIALDVADRRDAANLKYKVVTWDLEQQTENLIQDLGSNGFTGGSRPSFWGNDDFITFLLPDLTKGRKAYRIGVNNKGVATTTSPVELNPNAATVPIMHRAGVRALTGTLSLNVSRLDFGAVGQSDSKTLSITLTNGGNSDVSITRIDINNAQAFQTNLTNGLIPRGTSATFNVTFLPTGLSGTQIATLSITTDAQAASVNVPLNGTATGTPSGGGGGGGGGGCTMAAGASTVDYGLTIMLLWAIGGGLLRRGRPMPKRK